MPDFRVDDSAPEHPKLRAAGLAAAGLWAMAGAYSTGPTQLTDGWVPDYWVATWPGGKRQAARLIKVGLWSAEDRNGIPGYAFHDWADYQRAAAKLKDDRRKARERMAAFRSGAPKQSPTDGSSPDVRANKPRTFARTNTERSANVRDSLTLTPAGQVSGVPYGTQRAGAREERPPPKTPTSEDKPAERCDQHAGADGDPGPCRGCRDARIAAERWDTEHARRLVEARSTEAHAAAQARALAIADCPLCDDAGYRGRGLCTHDPDAAERAKRGRAAVTAALGRKDPE